MRKGILIIILVIVTISLVAFFYPKNSGVTCGFCQTHPAIHRAEYGCIGFKQDIPPSRGCMDCGTNIICYGIATSEKDCYTYMNDFKKLTAVPCK